MHQNLSKYDLGKVLNSLPLIWFFSGFLLIRNGQTYLAYFLVIATIYNIFTGSTNRTPIEKKYLITPVLIYLTSLFLTYLYTKEMWVVIRSTLYFLPFALTTSLNKNDVKKIIKIIPASAAIIGMSYLYINHYQGVERELSFSGLNPIPLATTLVMYLCVLSLSLLMFDYNKKESLIIIVGVFFLVFSIIMTETRSAWLCTIAITPITIYAYRKHISNGKRIILLSLISIVSLYLSFSNEINTRVQKTISEVHYIADGNFETSIGVRLQLWKTSLEIIGNSHYIFPTKEEDIKKYFKVKLAKGDITRYTFYHIGNSHNQYLNSWMRSGLLGLISTVVLIIAPPIGIYLSYGFNRSLLIITVCTSVLLSSMTEVPLTQISSYQAYLMTLLICFIIEEKQL